MQATRDIQRAEELVARQWGLQPCGDHRALRGHAEASGLSLHAAALAVLSSDPVVPRAAIPHQPAARDREAPVADQPGQQLDPVGTERLCVAARSVRARLPGLGAVDEADRGRLIEHTEALADLDRLSAMSPSEVATHAWVVRDALTAIGSDDALGIAVWFDDVLGADALVRA
ncbi:hypothetical protein [Actinomycetospora sp. TBRC 11914]|uniref:hypothetical protein n=1 Tax=Actinomycetospora sp. TBRC 11914 TaxID=2729387 RepID=UPI00145D05F0|nr:hypothetical protein [Actinomycetospora sp. TBRC 11914]NMO91819.1 hypothetical protein [Actinomycetospora sp. TBRC 11914]